MLKNARYIKYIYLKCTVFLCECTEILVVYSSSLTSLWYLFQRDSAAKLQTNWKKWHCLLTHWKVRQKAYLLKGGQTIYSLKVRPTAYSIKTNNLIPERLGQQLALWKVKPTRY